MKICFFFEDFDKDVSSGTSHSMSQWNELLIAFKVKDLAIINNTDEEIKGFSSNLNIKIYKKLEDFITDNNNSNIIYIEQGGKYNYKDYKYSKDEWYVFGSVTTLPNQDIYIETNGVALYSREAAAIILSEAIWQLR